MKILDISLSECCERNLLDGIQFLDGSIWFYPDDKKFRKYVTRRCRQQIAKGMGVGLRQLKKEL